VSLLKFIQEIKAIEYNSFSPFTLFADACTADAKDAITFNNEVALFLKNKEKKTFKDHK